MNPTPARAAMVLAAGRGERMRPLSDVLPKPALPFPDGPLIQFSVAQAAAAGVARIAVNTWHLASRMEAAVDELNPPGVDVRLSPEQELMGTAGGLTTARDRGLLLDEGPVLVLNGDMVFSLDLEPLFEHHARSKDLVTLAVLPHLGPGRWSRVTLDNANLVTAIEPPGQPRTGEVPFLYPGVMLVSRTALASLPTGPGEIKDRLWLPALEQNRLGAVVVSGHWREAGTPRDYLDAVLNRLEGRSTVAQSARVDPRAQLGAVLVGDDVVIAQGAVIGDSVVAGGARIEAGARVLQSVVLGPVVVAAGETVVGEFRAEPFG